MNISNSSKTIYQENGQGFTSRIRLAVNEVGDGDRVLEIGVGWGEFTRNIGKYKDIKLYGVDVAETALKFQTLLVYSKNSSRRMVLSPFCFLPILPLEKTSMYSCTSLSVGLLADIQLPQAVDDPALAALYQIISPLIWKPRTCISQHHGASSVFSSSTNK